LKKDAEQEQEEFQEEWNKLSELIEKDKGTKEYVNQQAKTGQEASTEKGNKSHRSKAQDKKETEKQQQEIIKNQSVKIEY
jgi:coiled-coil domain-containing protein 63/114